MAVSSSAIAENLQRVRERIARAAKRAGRRAEEITLVAVSKTQPAEAIREAWGAGVRHFGENRVQEWEAKHAAVADLDAAWHLVGHLQGNKARRAARLFHCVDSVDSVALAQKLDAAMAEVDSAGRGPRLRVLLEVRMSPEETKTGIDEIDLPGLAEAVIALPHIELRGLMCIPPFFENAEMARPYFRRLREARDSLREQLAASDPRFDETGGGTLLPDLSMGMSHDFEVAIEEGATQVRIGTALFGERKEK
jgi:pyridoxal phosphate enzyme (YggS family)